MGWPGCDRGDSKPQWPLAEGIKMGIKPGVWVHSVSVVVTAEFHNPLMLTPHFLTTSGIVPPEWKPKETMNVHLLAKVDYENQFHWTMTQDSLVVAQEWNGPIAKSYTVHELVSKYLKEVPHVPYRSLGLNCVMSILCPEPTRWLKDRFFDVVWPDDLGTLELEPRLVITTADVTTNLSIKSGQAKREEEEFEDAVIIECNVHHQGPLNSNDLIAAIDQWGNRQNFIAAALNHLLGSEVA